jgi:dienelactone hydrolase
MVRFTALMVALTAFATACAPDLPQQSPPDTVVPIWDPETPILPTPTDLVRDNATGRLDLPIEEGMPGAEVDFRSYLNSLDGYPLSSTLTIPMSGPVRPETLDGAVILHDLDADTAVPLDVRWDDDTQTIFAKPSDQTLKPGRRYAFGLWGYDNGARGTDGAQIVADAAFYLLRTERPLTEHLSALPGETLDDKREAANTLEDLKPDYQRYIDALAQRSVPRDKLAVVAGFTTTTAPTFWFDPDQGEIPIPNSLLINEQTGLVELPEDEEDDEEAVLLKETLNTYDGFSMTGVIRLKATAPVQPSSVNSETFRLFRVDGDQVIEDQDVDRFVFDDGVRIGMWPKLALEPATQYVVVATDGVQAGSGVPVGAQPISALLRGRFPIVDEDGGSNVSSIDDESAATLERARLEAEPVVDYLINEVGVARGSISAVVPFRTASSLRRFLDIRADLYERDVPSDVRNVINRTPNERGLGILFGIETVVTGQMTIWDRLDPRTRRFFDDGRGEENLVDFVLTIPESATPGEPIPVVLFGHGLFTSRELVYMIANRLAREGYAAFALDLPYHGRRSVCKEISDCKDDATCDEVGQCINPDGSKGELSTVQSPWPGGPEWPAVTGATFVEPDNIVGSRDHFQQAVADLLQGLRVIRGADWAAASGGYVLDGNDVMYLGMSLGGILGSNVAAVEPTIETFVLNVPGANYYQILSSSDAFVTAFNSTLDRRDLVRGSDDYITFQTGVRWLLDPVDPVNTVQHAVLRPYSYDDAVTGEMRTSPVKRVLIQMAEGDIVVPNNSTESLSERSGVPIQTYTPLISNHAFLFDPTSFEGARARNDMAEWFNDR